MLLTLQLRSIGLERLGTLRALTIYRMQLNKYSNIRIQIDELHENNEQWTEQNKI